MLIHFIWSSETGSLIEGATNINMLPEYSEEDTDPSLKQFDTEQHTTT